MSTQIVSSGQTVSNLTIGGTAVNLVEVQSGGVVNTANLLSTGTLDISAGGVVISSEITGTENIYFNGYASVATVGANGLQVLSGGFALSSTLTDGGQQRIYNHGFASQTLVTEGGNETVFSGGFAISSVVDNGGYETISSGGFANSTTVNGGSLTIDSGGTAVMTLISSGGVETVWQGGYASGDIAVSGGTQIVESGGYASNTLIENNGVQQVLAGGNVDQAVIYAGGQQTLTSGADAQNTLISGGVENIEGGEAESSVISAGGEQIVDSGGQSLFTTIASGGLEIIEQGANPAAVTMQAGAKLDLRAQSYHSGLSATLNSEQTLEIEDKGTVIDQVQLAYGSTNYIGDQFSVSNDGNGGILISEINVALDISSGQIVFSSLIGSDNPDTAVVALSGGFAINPIISDAGSAFIQSGAFSINAQIGSGATEVVSSGGEARGSVIASGGSEQLSGDGFYESVNGGNLDVDQGATEIAATVSNGGTLAVTSGGKSIGTIINNSGQEFALTGATVISSLVASGGALIVESGAIISDLTIAGSGALILTSFGYANGEIASLNSATDVLTITDGNDQLSLQLAGNYNGISFEITDNSYWEAPMVTAVPVPCFAKGTEILTTRGEIKVEDLTTNDFLFARISSKPHRVRWVGYRHTNILAHPQPASVRPVRILKGALGEHLPARDLTLSPHHAIYIDKDGGYLVPVRHLLNGASIYQESPDEITYYHIELADESGDPLHDVIYAHGLPVESFLDTGNRGAFENGDGAVMLHPDFVQQSWTTKGCAELVQQGPRIITLRNQLQARISALGFKITHDPALHLLIDGKIIHPRKQEENEHFTLPAGTRMARLVSRGFVPAQFRPDCADEEIFGVAVTAIALDGQEIALDNARLCGGWHPLTQGAVARWTDGNALIAINGATSLTLKRAPAGMYWERPLKSEEKVFFSEEKKQKTFV